ncbi:MAG: Methyltransferase type 12 [Pedosphaera sp.]|nr:Methyltransferase type 12 [Pedosphaera sp.]
MPELATGKRVATEKLTACPACYSTQVRFLCRARDRLYECSPQEFEYSVCRDCRTLFQSLRPIEAEIGLFYPPAYGPYQGSDEITNNTAPFTGWQKFSNRFQTRSQPLLTRTNRFLDRCWPDALPPALANLYQPPHPQARLLDFGCGSDRFLNEARGRGWKTLGLDFSLQAVTGVQRSGHEAYLISPAVWDEIPEASLDLVRMNHVLEHLYDPRETLAKLYEKMKPGARLHLAVPNPESLSRKLFRSCWFSLDCPRHIILHSPDALPELLRSAGFTGIKLFQETLSKDFVRSLGYWRVARGGSRRTDPAALAANPFLRELLHLPAKLAAALNRADRIHCFARK